MLSIEGSILESWEAWDELDTTDLMFYDVKIKQGVGLDAVIEKAADLSIDCAILLQSSILEFYWGRDGDQEGVIASYKIKLEVVGELV